MKEDTRLKHIAGIGLVILSLAIRKNPFCINPIRLYRSLECGMRDFLKEDLVARGIPYRAVTLLIPVLVVIIHIAVMAATLPHALFLIMIGLIVAYLLPPAGKETVIPIGIALGIPWWYMALSIVMIDIETGLFMALNFDIAYRIPFFGPLLSDLTKKTQQFISDHHWLAGLWFFAIVLMVMVPVFGSGGIRGSIAGKLLGMNTLLVFLAILAGALIGCFGIALGSDLILNHLCASGSLPAEIGLQVCGV